MVMGEHDYDYHDSFLPDGCVWCDKCGGEGLVPDFENWNDENCPVCYGEGFITKDRADRRARISAELGQILANALSNSNAGG
jgi:RecJ-like exonuclease